MNLTEIKLSDYEYISLETMVTCLSALANLKSLHLKFRFRSRPEESRRPTLPTCSIRSILPALTIIQFEGISEYLEDFVACIDTPQLEALIIFFANEIDLGVPQLALNRTPNFKTINEACVRFCGNAVRLTLSVRLTISSPTFGFEELKIQFSCGESNRQLSTLARIWTSLSPLFLMLDNFFIYEVECLRPRWQDNIEHTQWLEILCPFIAVQSLYVSREFAPSVATALQDLVRERTSEVLPALRCLFLEGLRRSQSVQASIGPFVVA